MHKCAECLDLDQWFYYRPYMAGEFPKEPTQLDELEQSQDALRRSIEESKRLADKSQQILDRHRAQSDGSGGK